MGVVEQLVSRILRLQINRWKPAPFDYIPSRESIGSQVADRFQEYDADTIHQATARFAERYLKVRPLKNGAFLNETAIKTASHRDLGVYFDQDIHTDICELLYELFEDESPQIHASRSTLIDRLNVAPERIDQNLYVLWSRGEVELSITPTGPEAYERVYLTKYGRKRHIQRESSGSP